MVHDEAAAVPDVEGVDGEGDAVGAEGDALGEPLPEATALILDGLEVNAYGRPTALILEVN